MKTLSTALGGFALAILGSPLAAQWNQAAPATSPTGRYGSAMTFDENLGKVLLFGGGSGFSVLNQTWTYDGTTWVQFAPATSPTGKIGAQMVHDPVRGVTLMYGSLNTSPFGGASVDQTWEFDGTTWTRVFPTVTPGGLGNYGMSFDLLRNRAVVYGGTADNFFPIAESGTWEYDGTNWALITTAGSPGPLERPAMCFDLAIGKTVLFGGIDPQTGGVDTTWLYDGTNWTAAAVVGAKPAVRTGAKMAYDTVRGVCVLSGGIDPNTGSSIVDTWEFDGTSWTQIATTTSGRYDAAMAFSPLNRQVVQFGGINPVTYTEYGDTWNYGAKWSTFGVGCAGSNGVPALTASDAPRIGQNFAITVGNLPVNNSFAFMVVGLNDQTSGLGALPLPLASLGMPGCTLYVSTDATFLISGAAGSATFNNNLPNDIVFTGLQLFHQAASIDASANAAGFAASNALLGIVGR